MGIHAIVQAASNACIAIMNGWYFVVGWKSWPPTTNRLVFPSLNLLGSLSYFLWWFSNLIFVFIDDPNIRQGFCNLYFASLLFYSSSEGTLFLMRCSMFYKGIEHQKRNLQKLRFLYMSQTSLTVVYLFDVSVNGVLNNEIQVPAYVLCDSQPGPISNLAISLLGLIGFANIYYGAKAFLQFRQETLNLTQPSELQSSTPVGPNDGALSTTLESGFTGKENETKQRKVKKKFNNFFKRVDFFD